MTVPDLLSFSHFLIQHTSLTHSLGKKATIHQATTMLSTSKNALFPGHNDL